MDDADLEMLNQREAERMSWCLADIIEVHGDPGFHGSRGDPWSSGTPVIYPHLDPTAEGVMMQEIMETVPTPPTPVDGDTPGGQPGQKPFILPPEERTEGKPFILPPDEREEGKPFILPPAEREEGKPFLETPRASFAREHAGCQHGLCSRPSAGSPRDGQSLVGTSRPCRRRSTCHGPA